MTAPIYFTIDGDPPNSIAPRRPGIQDVGGAAFVDDQAYPPDPTTFPSAKDENQKEWLIVGLAAVAPVAVLTIDLTSGNPVLASLATMSQVVVPATFTLTDNGNGDTTISWPAGTFPPSYGRPRITLDSDGAFLAPTYVLSTNSLRVKTRNSAGTLTNASFTLVLTGQQG